MVKPSELNNAGITDALNLWDIEMRIKRIHEELEILHQTKEEILGKKVKYDYGTANQNFC